MTIITIIRHDFLSLLNYDTNFMFILLQMHTKGRSHKTVRPSYRLKEDRTRLYESGQDVSGEWKVAIALRLLAGASYLDMFLWANIDPDYVRSLTRHTFKNWFCNDAVISINIYTQVLDNKTGQDRIRREFGESSGGIFNGCIGAVDGWLVRIRSPTLQEALNAGKYFSRKGFFAINVQVIVDKKRGSFGGLLVTKDPVMTRLFLMKANWENI